MIKYKITATAVPEFVTEATATLEEFGKQPLFTFSLEQLEPVIKTWLWQITQPQQPEQTEPEKFLTRQDVAIALRLSLPTVDKVIRAGVLKASKVGHRVLVRASDLQAALSEIQSTKYRRY